MNKQAEESVALILGKDQEQSLEPRQAKLFDIASQFRKEQREQLWTDVIASARELALATLPRRKTNAKTLNRTFQFAPDCVVTVKYSVADDCQMPYGSDRFVLFGLQHLARLSDSPLVEFEKAGQLLELFGLPKGGSEYRRLRERLDRLRSLNIDVSTKGRDSKWGVGTRVIEEYALPTSRSANAELAGQALLHLSGDRSPYFVQLSESLFQRVKRNGDNENILLVRLDLLKHFRDNPIGWDFCVFLFQRCGSAKTHSRVPHNFLMSFFKSGSEKDSATIKRLQGILAEIQTATDGAFNAKFVPSQVRAGKPRRGRPRKEWVLEVGPSKAAIFGPKSNRRSKLIAG